MKKNSSPEIKLINVINQIQDEIIGHKNSIIYAIQNTTGNVKNTLNTFSVSDEKDDKGEFLVKIPKSKYNELIQFLNRLSSYENYDLINTKIAEENSNIKYKNDLIRKLT